MRTIYRYMVERQGSTLEIPKGAKILSAAFKDEFFCFWCEAVETKDNDGWLITEKRIFKAFETGHQIEEGYNRHIGTAIMPDGYHVYHLYERAD